eukprot:1010287-Amphidinium_carterae.1
MTNVTYYVIIFARTVYCVTIKHVPRLDKETGLDQYNPAHAPAKPQPRLHSDWSVSASSEHAPEDPTEPQVTIAGKAIEHALGRAFLRSSRDRKESSAVQ